MIQLENVSKCYGSRIVFDGISLSVASGEFLAIMGTSGSGKSTLLNLIGGMDIPDAGRIKVGGEDISTFSEEELTAYRRQRVGFVFQFFNLLPNISIYENIEIPLLLNGRAGYEEKIRSYLKLMGLESRERDKPSSLSGGEQQRVSIARALIHDPDIILADEPTGNLDSRTGESIVSLIRNAAKKNRKTVVLVTHNLAVAEHADRIIKIQDGILLS